LHGTAAFIGLTCAATLGGHLWIAQHTVARHDRLLSESQAIRPLLADDVEIVRISDFDQTTMVCMEPSLAEGFAAYVAEEMPSRLIPRLLATLGHEALAEDVDAPADALQPGVTAEPPQALRTVAETERPLTKRERDDQDAVREVIEEEMPDTSAEERDIWFDELKSLPAEVVRDLLQVRQQMRVLSPDHPLSMPSQITPPTNTARVSPREIPAEPIAQSRSVSASDWSASRDALETAIRWSTHNLANSASMGYKRCEVILGDAYDTALAGEASAERATRIGTGCRLATLRLDLSPGELIATERPLDVAIDGPGLLLVKHMASAETFLTRRGMLTRDDQGQLCLLTDEMEYLIEPAIIVPPEAMSIVIVADGTVTVRLPGQETAQVCGRITLVSVADPSRLILGGDGLLTAPETMPPQPMEPGGSGAGIIRQGFLEASNVDVAEEESLRETWETMLRALPLTNAARTAGQASRLPK